VDDQFKKAQQVLVNLVKVREPALSQHPAQYRNYLRDLCPDHQRGVFVLESVASEGLLHNREAMGEGQSFIRNLADRIQDRLGIERSLALWAAESWALAYDKVDEQDVRREFQCGKCRLDGFADASWANKTVMCPRCRSRLVFDDEAQLAKTHAATGPQSDDAVSTWLVLDAPQNAETLSARHLRHAIERVLDDSSLNPAEKATGLQLRSVVSTLREEVTEVLEELAGPGGLACASQQELLERALRAFRESVDGLRLAEEAPQETMDKARLASATPDAEHVVGVLELVAFDEAPRYVVFGLSAIYFANSSTFKPKGPGCFRYEAFEAEDFRAAGLHAIALGNTGQVLETSGAATGKAPLLQLLRVVRALCCGARG
jgi:hypothetical protein